MSEELSPEEITEYEREKKELASPYFHDFGKCSKPLLVCFIFKKYTGDHSAKMRRQYCQTHKVIVDLSGWQLGFHSGESSQDLNP